MRPLTLAECLVVPARLGVLQDATQRLPDAVVLDTARHHQARAIANFDARLEAAAHTYGLDVLGPP